MQVLLVFKFVIQLVATLFIILTLALVKVGPQMKHQRASALCQPAPLDRAAMPEHSMLHLVALHQHRVPCCGAAVLAAQRAATSRGAGDSVSEQAEQNSCTQPHSTKLFC